MSILTHTQTRAVPLPDAVPTAFVFAAEDRDDIVRPEEIRAVLTLKVAMTRDMLAVALELGMRGAWDDGPVDAFPVEEIRHRIELTLHMESPWTIFRDSETFPELLDDPSINDLIRSVYRAVDRAYPHMAPKENV
ncbi:hypothetical protein [Streptomyces sp. NPDC058653]|uniref:hypothetical protein n=1 Tax=Streptomyces sp. NPDC058653 TaxID=3346576 RepID=UPI0036605EC9